MLNFLKNIGPTEIFIIVMILVLLFGGRVITGLARTSGKTFKEIKGVKKTFTEAFDEDNKPENG